MSTNYSAAIDTSDIKLAFADEATWGTAPTATFDQIRVTGESLSEQEQRNRPQEIKPDGVVSHAITTQVGVEGLAWYRHEGTIDCEGIGIEFEERARAMRAAVPEPQSMSQALGAEML